MSSSTTIPSQRSAPDPGRAASPWLSSSDAARARPLRVWNDRQTAAVTTWLHQLLSDWQRDWGLGEKGQHGAEEPASAAASTRPRTLSEPHSDHAPVAWAYLPSPLSAKASSSWQATAGFELRGDASTRVVQALYGALAGEPLTSSTQPHQPDSVATELVRAAWLDWWCRVGAVLPFADRPADADRPPGAALYFSGAMQLHLPWCAGVLVLELAYAQVEAVLRQCAPSVQTSRSAVDSKASSRLVSVSSILSDQPLTLRVMLRGTELNLRQIQTLRVGDVVPLTHRLEEPSVVVRTDGVGLCHGWLGQVSGQVAVELTSAGASALDSFRSP